nr:hypothetical protein [Corynebacterium lactis]
MRGQIFYDSGALKSVATYNGDEDQCYYGHSYPVTATFFDEDGRALHAGKFTTSRSGLGCPLVVEPEGYGALG